MMETAGLPPECKFDLADHVICAEIWLGAVERVKSHEKAATIKSIVGAKWKEDNVAYASVEAFKSSHNQHIDHDI